jgi:protein SCO1/2
MTSAAIMPRLPAAVGRRRLLVGAGGVAASLLLCGSGPALARLAPDYFPNVALTTQDGATVRFYDDLIRGKIVAINFIYTKCGDICPGMMLNLGRVQELLKDRIGRDFFMYSITLKPAEDTRARLADYAEAFGAGPGWLLLRAENDADTQALRRKLGFYDPDPVVDADLEAHVGLLRFGNERINRWAACPALSDPAEIAREIGWMSG